MSTTYELWDFDTRNLVGVFESEDAALAAVQEALHLHGPEAVVTLLLGSAEEDGSGGEIAAGDALIARAEAYARHGNEQIGTRR